MPEHPRLLILGSRGRLGSALCRLYTGAGHAVTALARSDLDLTRLDQIKPTLEAIPFDVAINAAGLTSVDACETRREEARLSNAEAPGILAAVCRDSGRSLIHISSDYVFSGSDHRLLTEDDPTGPCNYYGQTKLNGEIAVLDAFAEALVVRVSWLFGPDKDSFPDMIIRNALAQPEVSAVNDKWSSPTFADDLGAWLLTLATDHPEASGLLHLSNAGAPSWQEYGQYALDIAADLGLPLKARTVEGHSMHGFPPFKATRPPFTALDTSRFQHLTGIQTRPWQDALEECLRAKLRP